MQKRRITAERGEERRRQGRKSLPWQIPEPYPPRLRLHPHLHAPASPRWTWRNRKGSEEKMQAGRSQRKNDKGWCLKRGSKWVLRSSQGKKAQGSPGRSGWMPDGEDRVNEELCFRQVKLGVMAKP